MTRTLLPLLALLVSALPAAAQTVRGTLVDPASGAGIRGATVVLMDAGGREAASVLTGPGGEFTLRAPGAGRFSLRAERTGYASSTPVPLTLAVGETVEQKLTAGPAVMLDGLVAEARSRCVIRPGTGPQTALLWEEARKALHGTRQAAEQRRYRFRVRGHRRELDPRTGTVRREEAIPEREHTGTPFVSAPPEQLAARGYLETSADTLVFYAPDAGILLSGTFQESHCFRVETRPDDPSVAGLAFEPVRGTRQVDVEGVLWVDRATSELRRLEYRYTGLPGRRSDAGRVGGEMEFRRLPGGSWIVSRWRIRMPVLEPGEASHPAAPGLSSRALLALAEEAREVAAITGPAGEPVAVEAGATLAGTVFDSTRAAPLAGARVFVSGTPYEAVTDSAGRFAFHDLPEGRYTVSFTSPRADSLGWVPAPVEVVLRRAESTALALSLPTAARAGETALAANPAPPAAGPVAASGGGGTTVVTGRVLERGSERPVAGVAVSVGPDGRVVRTDASGFFVLRGVPRGPQTLALRRGNWRGTLEVAPGTAPMEYVVRIPPAAQEAVTLEPLVATARALTPAEVERTRLGANVRVIRREDLLRTGAASLNVKDVLRATIPRLWIRERAAHLGSVVTTLEVTYLGEPVMVYLDGIPLTFGDFARLQPAEIESMEFHPQGAGSNAGPTLLIHSLREKAIRERSRS
jgi:hypothetical protein